MEKVDFLKSTTPFDQLPAAELESISDQMEYLEFKRSEVLYQQQQSKVHGLDILVAGSADTYFINSSGTKELTEHLIEGETYGAFSILLNKGKSIKTVACEKGTAVYRIPGPVFRELCEKHEGFYLHFLSAFGKEMLNERFANYISNPQIDLDTLTFDRYFVRRMDSVGTREILACDRHTPCHEAARLMEEYKMSCIFISENNQFIGYVTDIVFRNKIIGGEMHSATPVGEIMEHSIYRINRKAFIYEAILMMFQHKIRYLIVEEDGEDIGVISRNKLLSDQSQSPFVFIQSVRLSQTVEELKFKWSEVPEVVYNLLTRGVRSELVNQVITNISDTIAQKIIEGVIKEIGDPPAKFVFMALGSEGRKEQTLKTDQDNAIIYEDKANEFREKTRKYFLHFAELVSERLDVVGFSFCTGGLMAKNPKWTHSLSHWKRNYNQWIENPDPQSVMNFSTFFDCRFIFGEEDLIHDLQEHILTKLDNPGDLFFAQLANNALQYEPPLTFFKGIKTISKGDRQVFNIKRAMTPIVDLVRVFALKHKTLKTNTGERLAALRDEKIFTDEDYNELLQSYYYLMSMRLRYQSMQIIMDHDEPHNYVSPEMLTKIETVTLKEIFKVIENFQQRIKIIFTRNLFG